MSTRTRQAHQLGWALKNDLALQSCELQWSGQPRRGAFGGWRLEWTDGPDPGQMRAGVGHRAKQFPAVPVAELAYDRNLSGFGEAIIVPLYLGMWPRCVGGGWVAARRSPGSGRSCADQAAAACRRPFVADSQTRPSRPRWNHPQQVPFLGTYPRNS